MSLKSLSGRPTYAAPCAMRLDASHAGHGRIACDTGTGDVTYCSPGSAAAASCQSNGSDAGTWCQSWGTSPATLCVSDGSSPPS